MNELGLSRESVRQQVDEIVRETIRKHVSGPQFTVLVEREIKAVIESSLKGEFYDRNKFQAHVVAAIKNQVADAVNRSLRLEIVEQS